MSAGGDVKLTIGTSITYQGPSSFQQIFTGTAPYWTTPAGMDATLYGPNGSSQYTLTYHDNGQVLTFNSTGQLIKNADRNGNAITYSYNGSGTLSQITDATSRTVTFNYGGNGNVSTMVDNSLNRTYTYTINGSHNLTGYTDPANPTKAAIFTYDTLGKHELVDIKDPAGNGETKLTYDTNHRVTELQFVYDTVGDTYNKIYTYNSGTTGSRCDSSLSPAGNTVVTDEDGHNTDYCWDSSGRVIETLDGLGHATITHWNSDDKPLSVTDRNGDQTSYQYNDTFAPNENITTVIGAGDAGFLPPSTTYAYGDANNHYAPTAVYPPQGNSFFYAYDSNGNRKGMTNNLPSQNTVTYTYLSNGELGYLSDAKGDVSCYNGSTPETECRTYDAHGAISSDTTPATVDHFTHDSASRLQTHTDGKSQVTTYSYDNVDRGTQIAYTSSNTCPTPSATCTVFVYDADGNLTSESDSTGTTTYQYDKLNRRTQDSEPGLTATSYTYDGVGNLTTLTNGLGSGNVIHYGYDAANHMTSLWLGSTTSTCSSTPTTCTTFDYDGNGNRRHTYYPNGVTMTMTYNNLNNLTEVKSATTSLTLTDKHYSYAVTVGGATTETGMKTGLTDSGSGTSWSYGYDGLDRFTAAVPNSGSATRVSLDANSNDCGRTDGSACQGGTLDPMQYDAGNQLKNWNGITYNYDLNGNLASWNAPSGDSGSETYNAQNQWTAQGHGTSTINYTYRGVGQGDRATATGSFGNQAWTSDLLGVSTETNSAQSACPCYYVRDTQGKLVEEVLSTGTYYPVYDGTGSVIALTNSSASVVDSWTYTSNGQTTQTGTVYEPWQYQGEYMDTTAGQMQYHNGARYYEAGMMGGHWTQQDPISSAWDHHGWNEYNYAGADPLNLADPNGMGDWWNPTSWSCDVCGQWANNFVNAVSGPLAACGTAFVFTTIASGLDPIAGGIGCGVAFTSTAVSQAFGEVYGRQFDTIDNYYEMSEGLGLFP